MEFQPEYLIICIITGIISLYFARKRGYKNLYLYFWTGFFLGLIGMAFLFLSEKKSNTKAVSQTPVKISAFELRLMEIWETRFSNKLWYYLDSEMEQKGPVSASLLQEKIRTGHIVPDTYLWNEELDDWKPLESLLSPTE